MVNDHDICQLCMLDLCCIAPNSLADAESLLLKVLSLEAMKKPNFIFYPILANNKVMDNKSINE